MVAGLIGPCMENVQQVVVGVSNLEVEPALHQHQHMEVLNVLVLLMKKSDVMNMCIVQVNNWKSNLNFLFIALHSQ